MDRYDERNVLFSRLTLVEGTQEYKEYYELNPEMEKLDKAIRNTSFQEGLKKSESFKQLFNPLLSHNAELINVIRDLTISQPLGTIVETYPGFENNIKEIAKYYGATEVGITKIDNTSLYSHHGRTGRNESKGDYGERITKKYKTAIVFTVQMDLSLMNRAPHFEQLLATEEGYVKIAEVGSRIAMYLKNIGYDSMFNSSEYYEAPMVPLAFKAGLGEIGICNHLITKKHGNNVRIGAVFTTLELKADDKVDFGLKEFCRRCSLCLINCPSNAITSKPRVVNGDTYYKFNEHSCYDIWTKTGTDCGICIQSCPFTQGIDIEVINKLKDNPDLIDEFIGDYLRKHGRRQSIKMESKIIRIE